MDASPTGIWALHAVLDPYSKLICTTIHYARPKTSSCGDSCFIGCSQECTTCGQSPTRNRTKGKEVPGSSRGIRQGREACFAVSKRQHYQSVRLIPLKDPSAADGFIEFAVNGSAIPDVSFDIGESYAGLLPISSSPNETRELYFWFFPSENPAAADEITIW